MKLVLAAVVLAAAVLASAASAAPRARPVLTLVAASPATVHGTKFRAAERVRVVFDLGAQRVVRLVRANRAGAFTVAAGAAAGDRCGDLILIRAVGVRSGQATVKLQLPDCAPQP